MVWLAPTVRAVALSQSVPTPKTHDPFRVVTSVAVGAALAALALLVAPMAPAPLVPEESAPIKLMMVIEEATFCDRVAVMVTLLSFAVAKARQISAVPL